MVIPLFGVKTRCADKSTAKHFELTYIAMPWYHWLVTFVPLVPMALPFLPFAPFSLPMIPLVIKLVPMVQMLPTNGTIGEPRTHAMGILGANRPFSLKGSFRVYSLRFALSSDTSGNKPKVEKNASDFNLRISLKRQKQEGC